MPYLPELNYSAEILFRNWLCLTEFDWCASLETVVSMGSRSALVGPKLCFPLATSSVERRKREWLFKSHCALWSLETACCQSRMWLKKPNPGLKRYLLRLFTVQIQIENFGGTHNWKRSIKQASAQHGSYR
jgi:hypothetical protein